ncbi:MULTISPECIES: hemolysin family protein [unclassified Caulobacter]|uniref:hemolysin family protein n=1 Tax=unclassified Caulobacter TaxID=2648921 RepID=UPI000D333AE2|nr:MULTISPECIES: hemolysin family protein [unclassified Caulobacter]PTS91121.1 magnesium/cobalt efflux protein [Caulobacter sp. HMWF009]PTT09864.1 magnesium/cobalt efflux protein [Caulobacter sp. HMWF025]
MPSDDSSHKPAVPERQSRGVRAFFRKLRQRLVPPGEPERSPDPVEAGADDIVDQAEAFKSLRVADLMIPRADVVAVELSTPFEALVAQFTEAENSRMPIYRETLDEPVGVVHVKDVFRLLAAGAARPGPDDQVLQSVRREALYVPASMRAADLLLRMRAGRIHMALVIDEFGGTDGLVTLEDLLEAVVGEIDDEHDDATVAGIVARPGGIFDADARAPLEELEAALGQELAPPDLDEEIDTVAGLVVALAGRVPQRGEVIPHPDGYELEVVEADPRRVLRVRVRPVALGS